ncbi:recombinase family protein [Rathayibacter caricis]|uniref:recombinase family protein n=1 Tax=Rathayibacter caricis TaxID=110936 RepID=UPI003CC831FF
MGDARVSTDKQDAQAQRVALLAAGVPAERISVDAGLIGSNRERPALREALDACDTGSVRHKARPPRTVDHEYARHHGRADAQGSAG